MIISRLINEYSSYRVTDDYIRGILVELTGTAIEILILSITIPLIFIALRRIRTRPMRAMVDFYLFQVFHKIARLFLDMASVNDVLSVLGEEQKKNPNLKIYSSAYYGNLENLLFVMNKAIDDANAFSKSIKCKKLEDFQRYCTICERCLEEVDRLTAMLAGVPNVQEELFHIRILIFPLRDLMEECAADKSSAGNDKLHKHDHTYEILRSSKMLSLALQAIFMKRRKLIDSISKHQLWASTAMLFLSIPFIILRRPIYRFICRLKKIPYRDYPDPSDTPEILLAWRTERGLSIDNAASILGITKEEYHDLEFGYKEPNGDTWARYRKDRAETEHKTNES